MPEQQLRPPRQGLPPRPHGTPAGPPPDEDARAGALRWFRAFGLVMLAALGLGLLTLPWPWALAPGLLSLAALVVGIVALVKVRVAKVRGAVTPVLVVGLVLAAFLALAASGQLVLWREYSDYSECRAGAITEQAKDNCIAQLERSLEDRMQQVLQQPQG